MSKVNKVEVYVGVTVDVEDGDTPGDIFGNTDVKLCERNLEGVLHQKSFREREDLKSVGKEPYFRIREKLVCTNEMFFSLKPVRDIPAHSTLKPYNAIEKRIEAEKDNEMLIDRNSQLLEEQKKILEELEILRNSNIGWEKRYEQQSILLQSSYELVKDLEKVKKVSVRTSKGKFVKQLLWIVAEHSAEIRKLREKCSTKEEMILSLSEKYADLQEKFTLLESECSEVKKELQNVNKKMDDMKKENEQKMEEMKANMKKESKQKMEEMKKESEQKMEEMKKEREQKMEEMKAEMDRKLEEVIKGRNL